jgi:hemin uptake protein HemP
LTEVDALELVLKSNSGVSGERQANIDPPRVVASTELFAGRRVVFIEHAGQRYHLLITRNNRLILQK